MLEEMRISWLEPGQIAVAREALSARGDWATLFDPAFEPPPAPEGVADEDWPHIAEHVARAERVSQVLRTEGFQPARDKFGGSRHAIEQATLAAAAVEVDQLELALIEDVLSCEIDELVTYGTFLALLVELGANAAPERMIRSYERFCEAAVGRESRSPVWEDRVEAIRDGLANVYVICGRHDEAHAMYEVRHREATEDLVVALAASRAFLASSNVARAVQWLGIGADRARELGRAAMETRLRQKADALRKRMS